MNSRKTARAAVSGLLKAQIATLIEVYDHETKNFKGLSPVAMVYSDGTAAGPGETFGEYHRQQALLVSLWWRRDVAQNSEDYLDDLSQAVRDLIEANDDGATWESLRIDDSFSVMDYPIVDGVMYRRETLRVIIW